MDSGGDRCGNTGFRGDDTAATAVAVAVKAPGGCNGGRVDTDTTDTEGGGSVCRES